MKTKLTYICKYCGVEDVCNTRGKTVCFSCKADRVRKRNQKAYKPKKGDKSVDKKK